MLGNPHCTLQTSEGRGPQTDGEQRPVHRHGLLTPTAAPGPLSPHMTHSITSKW